MAIRLAEAEEAMRAERQLLKERVLQIDQLTAEAEVSVRACLRVRVSACLRVCVFACLRVRVSAAHVWRAQCLDQSPRMVKLLLSLIARIAWHWPYFDCSSPSFFALFFSTRPHRSASTRRAPTPSAQSPPPPPPWPPLSPTPTTVAAQDPGSTRRRPPPGPDQLYRAPWGVIQVIQLIKCPHMARQGATAPVLSQATAVKAGIVEVGKART
jgi:hypothetical protein